MKVEINKKKFIESLSIGGSYAGNAKALPILDCVKIKVKNGSMNIISSDNENAISKRCEIVSSDFEGDFCVGYKSLMQYVKLVSGENVELILNDDMSMLSIKHKKGSLELPIQKADEFPVSKMDKDCVEVNIDSATINNWLVDAKLFIADDTLRPQLNGVYIYRREGELGCCGTDGHKMYYNFIEDLTNEDFEFIINKKSISSICSICKSTDELKIKIGKVNTSFVGNGVTLVSRNIEGRFPQHKSVIAKDNNIEVVFDCNELKEAVMRCLVGASQTSSLIKFDIKGSALTLSAEDIDFSVKSIETMFINSNSDITIGFKADYILNILSTITTQQCLLKLKDPTRAGLFHEYNNEKISSNKLSLLMPMAI